MQTSVVDVVISEQQFPDGRGVDFLKQMRVLHPNTIRILVALPVLFAAGMAVMDTTDGVLMVKAYNRAFVNPPSQTVS